MQLTDERIEELRQQKAAMQAESEAKAAAEAAAAASARQAEITSAERRARVKAAEREELQETIEQERAQREARLEAARAFGRAARINLETIKRIATQGEAEVERLHAASGRPYAQIVPPFNDPEGKVSALLPGGVQSREEALAFVAGVREVFEAL